MANVETIGIKTGIIWFKPKILHHMINSYTITTHEYYYKTSCMYAYAWPAKIVVLNQIQGLINCQHYKICVYVYTVHCTVYIVYSTCLWCNVYCVQYTLVFVPLTLEQSQSQFEMFTNRTAYQHMQYCVYAVNLCTCCVLSGD